MLFILQFYLSIHLIQIIFKATSSVTGGEACSVATAQLQGPQFNPELNLLPVCMFSLCPYYCLGFSKFVSPPKKRCVSGQAKINCLSVFFSMHGGLQWSDIFSATVYFPLTPSS